MNKKSLSWVWVLSAAALLSAILSACAPAGDPSPQAVLTSVTVTPANANLAPGTTRQFTAIATYEGGSTRNVTLSAAWESSDTGIATISNTPGTQGLATATLTTGSTTITATYGGMSGSATLATLLVTSIAVTTATPQSIAPGTTKQYIATGTLSGGGSQTLTDYATWSSLDTGIATFNNTSGPKGLATAVSAGTTDITATFGAASGSASFTSSALVSIAVTPTNPDPIAKGTTQQFAATGTLEDATTQILTTWATWSSSVPGYATISNTSGTKGLATSVDVGSTNITAEFTTITSNTAVLAVTAAELVSIAVTPTAPNIALGLAKLQFTATGTFTDSSTQDITSSVTWSSSNSGVATISTTGGLATFVDAGSTTIEATLGTITDSTTLTVAALQSIEVTPIGPISIALSGTQQFTATGTYTNNAKLDLTSQVTWDSSVPSIATISNAAGSQGLATASSTATGTTTITATSLSGIIPNSVTLTVQ